MPNNSDTLTLGKINCIKLLRMFLSVGLVESEEMVEEFYRVLTIEEISNKHEFNKFCGLMKNIRDGKIQYDNGYYVKVVKIVMDSENLNDFTF